MSFRFPGAGDRATFWSNLVEGRESLTRLEPDSLRAAGVPADEAADPDYVAVAPLMEGADEFDAEFFGYTPREAQIRDPQSRLFLAHCHAALEDAGHNPRSLPGHVGVFGGMANNLYGEHNVARNARVREAVGGMAIEVSNSPDYLCSNVSYRLGLNGPSLTVQAACSTSLVAVHLASQSLRSGECDVALAGGVEVELPYGAGYLWAEGSIYSRSGHVRPFSADADGTVFGSGVGVVVLRRLSEALADGDAVYAVVRGSAVNNDGADRAGFTAPGVRGQSALVLEALADAQVDVGSIGYVEGHATGTLVGDPIEVAGLKHAFAAAGDARAHEVPLGSVKGNVGHLGPAAGMAGLVKVCLAMQHGAIPPTINVDEVNPRLGLDGSPFFVAREAVAWPDGVRRAGVSSFGIGGTNAHVILEEAPGREAQAALVDDRRAREAAVVLPVSARNAAALDRARAQLAEHLRAHPSTDLDTVAWTLQDGRTSFEHRTAVVARDVADAVAHLEAPARPVRAGANPRTVLMLPGQGAQHPAMARELLAEVPAFAASVEATRARVLAHSGIDVLPLLTDPDVDPALLAETRVTQPLLFTTEVATAAALSAWGVVPEAFVGHSVGEIAAAHLAGALDLDDATRLVCERGRLLHESPPGAMLAVAADWPDVQPLVGHLVELAAVNAPRSITVAGSDDDVVAAAALLGRLALPTVRLRTSHAFHSRSVEAVGRQLAAVAATLTWRPATGRFLSGVTGEWADEATYTDPAYWVRQVREPVMFDAALRTLLDGTPTVLVESGPGRTLSGFAAGRSGARTVATATGEQRGAGALQASLWEAGVPLDWRSTWPATPPRTHLPTYPFERTRHWVDPDPEEAADVDRVGEPVALRTLDDGAFGLPLWRETVPTTTGASAGSPVLVIAEARDDAEGFVRAFAGAGSTVVGLARGPFVTEADPDDAGGAWWSADLASKDEVVAVVRELALRTGADHATVLVVAPADGGEHLDAMVRSANGLFDQLLVLAQALASVPTLTTELVVVTSSLYDVGVGATTAPGQATALGPVLLLPREATHTSARLVDVVRERGEVTDASAAAVVREVGRRGAETRVALRDGRRYALGYEPFGLPRSNRVPFEDDATYVVTGGLGGLGLEVAEAIARVARVNFVLVSRRTFTPRSSWDAAAADPATPETRRRLLDRLLAIEATGSRVTVETCDVTDAEEVRTLVGRLRARGVRVRGLLHSAGVAGGGMLAGRSHEAAHAVLTPKVEGTVNLYRELGEELDLLVLFSSVTAVTGTFGMVDYCAANNFLDAFAAWASARGTRTISIGWAGWSEVGMAEELRGAAPAAFRALQEGGDVADCAHPLLDRMVQQSATEIIAETDLWPGRHWVTSEHVIRGREVVVGTALIEMVLAAHAEAVGTPVHVESAAHLAAVAVTGPVLLRTRLVRPSVDEPWQATVEWTAPDGPDRAWSIALAASLVPGGVPVPSLVDVDALLAEHPGTVPAESLAAPHLFLEFGERWRSIVATSYRETSELARLVLPAQVRQDADRYILHPALLDVAVGDAQHGLLRVPGTSYLPLSYESIGWNGPLPSVVWSHIRHRDDRTGAITVADIELLDAEGRLLVEVRGFAMRRVEHDRFSAELAAPPVTGPGSRHARGRSTATRRSTLRPGSTRSSASSRGRLPPTCSWSRRASTRRSVQRRASTSTSWRSSWVTSGSAP
ncbi:SDR family NAD(P)-dependent oxidoreductase [Oerskovia sp. Sa1BUA8]|uniref:SDR family NAD(P)-dependent oxidoreductase n=2 Tax=Oerskovia douganii TaxID=2762210 RepID=A0A9D5U9F8_9CELL|nr:SDR family NAD(P)-dependent oxidoreductase [Oerskovia douganii]